MVRISVKFRTSAVQGKSGAVYYQLSHHKTSGCLDSHIRIRPEEWRLLSAKIRGEQLFVSPVLLAVQREIDDEMTRIHRIADAFEQSGEPYTAAMVIRRYVNSREGLTLRQFADELIVRLSGQGRLGTADNYRRTLSSFSSYLCQDDLPLSRLTERLVLGYSDWLSARGIVRNSVSFYMRNLRAIYNKAVRLNIVCQTHPFGNVYTGIDRTRKRAVSEDCLVRLCRLDLCRTPSLQLARDLFIFSYYARGMAFVDMAYLRKTDIVCGVITYRRHKTGRPLNIRVERCMQDIIDRYALHTRQTPYVFPILHAEEPSSAYAEYQEGLNYYNKRLRRLSELLGEGVCLSSYTARHSWATAARDHQVPLSVISAGMGHASERTTQIYLASLETAVIDRANWDIISALQHRIHKC